MATIQGVYVALFGRPADPAGLAFFKDITNDGADLSAIGDLASTKEYQDRFKDQSNLQIVRSIYQSLFNRDPDAAGLNFFVDALNKGTLNINNIAIAILDGAQGADKTTVENKIKSADAFTKAIDTPEEIAAYSGAAAAAAGRAYLAGVTTTAKTDAQAADAVKGIVTIGTGGVNLTIAAADSVSPTATETKFQTTGGDDTVTVSPAGNPTGTLDGGFGNDTLKFTTNGAFAPAADAIKNFENLKVTVANAAHTLDLTEVAGLKTLVNEKSTVAFDASEIASGVSLAVNEGVASKFAFAEAQTGTTSVSLTKSNGTLEIVGGADTVALSTSGGSTVTTYTDVNVKNLSISGSGAISITAAAGNTKLAKVDASALSDGKLTLNLAAIAADQKLNVTGSNAADAITLSANNAADVLVYNKAEASTYVTFETITNFKADGAANIQDKIDLKAFTLTNTADITLINTLVEGASFGTNSVAKYQVTEGGVDSTFVFVDSNGDGKINQATDFAIKLVGVDAADVDVANFVFA